MERLKIRHCFNLHKNKIDKFRVETIIFWEKEIIFWFPSLRDEKSFRKKRRAPFELKFRENFVFTRYLNWG